jgi:hypothetical protein
VQLAFWSSHSFDRLEEAAPLMGEILSSLADDERTRQLLVQLYVYLLRAQRDVDTRDVRAILLEMAGPRGREDVMTAGEQLIQQGVQRGLQRGRVEALRAAIAAALSARGLTYGDASRAKLAACDDLATLTRWHARAVTAPAEAEVFSDAE